jgi:hypothetical protein
MDMLWVVVSYSSMGVSNSSDGWRTFVIDRASPKLRPMTRLVITTGYLICNLDILSNITEHSISRVQ